jgi:hypothetical protein
MYYKDNADKSWLREWSWELTVIDILTAVVIGVGFAVGYLWALL